MSGRLLETTRADFAAAHDVSAYSLLALSRAAYPLMSRAKMSVGNVGMEVAGVETSEGVDDLNKPSAYGGSITTISFLGAQKAAPSYNVMGPAKASLEVTFSCEICSTAVTPCGVESGSSSWSCSGTWESGYTSQCVESRACQHSRSSRHQGLYRLEGNLRYVTTLALS